MEHGLWKTSLSIHVSMVNSAVENTEDPNEPRTQNPNSCLSRIVNGHNEKKTRTVEKNSNL